jgi:hypothetical protein
LVEATLDILALCWQEQFGTTRTIWLNLSAAYHKPPTKLTQTDSGAGLAVFLVFPSGNFICFAALQDSAVASKLRTLAGYLSLCTGATYLEEWPWVGFCQQREEDFRRERG